MKLKYDFVINEVAGSMVAVPIGELTDTFNGFIKMNENTAFVMECLKNNISEDELVKAITEKFAEQDTPELRADLRDLLADFENRGMLEK